MSVQEYYSFGKLMLCGEYAVLGGATAFVLPTQSGQKLRVEKGSKNKNPQLSWKAFDKQGSIWFEAGISIPHLLIEYSSDPMVAIQLLRFLINARCLNPFFLADDHHIKVETMLEFDPDEGLGSSSTLTNNIAQWAQINPFSLHFNAFQGSAFDVAAAMKGVPLLYTMNGSDPVIEVLSWDKPFTDQLFFVYLNKKTSSRENIGIRKPKMSPALIAQISRISRLISVNEDYFEFCLLLELAENEMSKVLGRSPVKQELFADFPGTVKSLGAWGGDYVLATGKDTVAYFESKGYNRIVPYSKMIR